ncbi:Emopamil-binding protein [Sporormia fimetaria CBS 119925]|uniref:Emopamil-binding protein n=1 Tax=Sporormia fimetaria CBS 119925 TaxID=1340428 RepID=A0A6A6VPD9_9PLEO|nr:Emopamil-binding protein [Sporormia fimetaria CBS 119925]
MAWGKTAAPKPAAPPPVYHHSTPGQGPVIDATTITSLLAVVALLGGAYAASLRLLPKTSSTKTRILFIWHSFDALIHLVFEGSFLWNCFFVSYSLPTTFSASNAQHPHIRILTAPDVYWLKASDKLYGAAYGAGPFSKLWQEYAKADHRWGGVDLTVVTLEILTVGVGAPLALWICWQLRGEERKGALKRWFWTTVLATAELYGGWMTFAPEWFSGSPNLDTSNWMYTWLYLAFFNGLWVVFPLWILWESYAALSSAMSQAEMIDLVKYLKKDE